MRLDPSTRQCIHDEVRQLLGDDSQILLFGSRVDDAQRGGDIDLLIEPATRIDNRVQLECTLAARLYIALGGRKVDVLINDQDIANSAVVRLALEHGIRL